MRTFLKCALAALVGVLSGCQLATSSLAKCSTAADCPAGQVCGFAGTCATPACSLTCDGKCTNGNTDVNNCGGCGTKCPGGAACDNGSCTCPAAQSACGGVCVNTSTDIRNCGSCGTICSSRNGVGVCQGGQCLEDQCSPPFIQCAAGAACSINPTNDVLNCGGCGLVCGSSNANPTCTGGVCVLNCEQGWANCSGNPATGCETNTDHGTASGADTDNCGLCGYTCVGANGTSSCSGGQCEFACNNGWGHCHGDSDTAGCATATGGSDPQNCGGCGVTCSNSHATPTCQVGVCIKDCATGYDNCTNDVQANGCNVDLLDPYNCGSCGTICAPPTQCCPKVLDTFPAFTEFRCLTAADCNP